MDSRLSNLLPSGAHGIQEPPSLFHETNNFAAPLVLIRCCRHSTISAAGSYFRSQSA